MNKLDLNVGNLIELRNGDILMVIKDMDGVFLAMNNKYSTNLNCYELGLERGFGLRHLDIVRIGEPKEFDTLKTITRKENFKEVWARVDLNTIPYNTKMELLDNKNWKIKDIYFCGYNPETEKIYYYDEPMTSLTNKDSMKEVKACYVKKL